jgi:RNA polymerase sigma-70 factor (ECF subfamily)
LAVSEDDPPDPPDPNPGPEHIASARETLNWLEGALTALPPAQREVLLLTAIVGLRQQDVAQALDLPLNTVKTHLRRARLALAARLAARNAPSGTTRRQP